MHEQEIAQLQSERTAIGHKIEMLERDQWQHEAADLAGSRFKRKKRYGARDYNEYILIQCRIKGGFQVVIFSVAQGHVGPKAFKADVQYMRDGEAVVTSQTCDAISREEFDEAVKTHLTLTRDLFDNIHREKTHEFKD